MYNNYIVPNALQHNEYFLRHGFIPVMLDALGLNDNSGVIYEILEHDYFALRDVGEWDKMMPGMINVNIFYKKRLYCKFFDAKHHLRKMVLTVLLTFSSPFVCSVYCIFLFSTPFGVTPLYLRSSLGPINEIINICELSIKEHAITKIMKGSMNL